MSPNYYKQEARQYGRWLAFKRLCRRRHVLQGLAFLGLALAITIALVRIRDEGIARRVELAQATAQSILTGCNSVNRHVLVPLHQIIQSNLAQLKIDKKKGLLPKQEIKQALKETKADLRKLKTTDCTSLIQNITMSQTRTTPLPQLHLTHRVG